MAAAIEGRFLGLPSIAVSLATRDHKGLHYDSAAEAVLLLLRRLPLDPRAETPIRADKSAIAYRRWLSRKGIAYGVIPQAS